MTELRRVLRRAADSRSVFLATNAVETERLYISFSGTLNIYAWGDLPPAPTVHVSVPRSLRRYFGRTVEALAPHRGRRNKKPPRHNRHAKPEVRCEC